MSNIDSYISTAILTVSIIFSVCLEISKLIYIKSRPPVQIGILDRISMYIIKIHISWMLIIVTIKITILFINEDIEESNTMILTWIAVTAIAYHGSINFYLLILRGIFVFFVGYLDDISEERLLKMAKIGPLIVAVCQSFWFHKTSLLLAVHKKFIHQSQLG